MPPFELDKPPKAPINADRAELDEVEILDVDAATDGHQGTLVRGPDGNIAYPGYVPPQIESPTSPHHKTNLAHETSPGNKDDFNQRESKKTQRPSFAKFFTDAPRIRGSRASPSSKAPLPARATTNTSILDDANLEAQDDSSSSSSSDDENTHDPRQKTKKPDQRSSRPRRKALVDRYRRFHVGNDSYVTRGKVSGKDGRLNITLNDTSDIGYLAKTLGAAIQKIVPGQHDQSDGSPRPSSSGHSSVTTAAPKNIRIPKLNIVIMVIGSRGDVQPFLKIGKDLKEKYGHRVRIATHPAFRDLVKEDCGLEFFSIGGDPSELMAFMVKNPGMIPKLETVKAGDIGRRRAAMAEMFDGFWRACVNETDNEKDNRNLKMAEREPFVADAIIANPPSFAHIHCAEALGVPLHLMFTFPYTPTQDFPHPLAHIKKTNIDPGYTNFMSYPLVEMMVWQGLGDLVNDFRVKTLGLDPIHTLWAPGSVYRLHVPYSYLWSPALVPKPKDWGHEIDISGFVFLDLASSFEPPQDLVDFLEAGEQPIYIGFGSIVVDDADKFTEMIYEAVQKAGVRALVSKGWGGLGQDNSPENIYMLENTPHDWLFPRVKACVIHGGAGTTAIALKCGKPTMIVPFFGDQNFWGARVSNAGAGPEPVPYKQLNAEKLVEGIKYCLTEEVSDAALKLSQSIEAEGDGAHNAVMAFHRHLKLSGEESMRCSLLEDRIAAWTIKGTSLKLSPLAAQIAVERGLISWRMLRLLRHKDWNDFEGPGEPVTGIAGSLMGTVGDLVGGIGSLPYRLAKTSKRRKERQGKNRQRQRKPRTSSKDRKGSSGSGSRSATRRASPAPDHNEYLEDFQKGVGKSGRAFARAPVDLSLALAQGFHNAPRLYGDTTVRQPIRVTGISSGLKAARDEFLYGIYDGFTGLVRLPYHGAKKGGFKGVLAGIGMGVIGFLLKDLAALFGPIAYTLQGIAKEISGGQKQAKHVRRARIGAAQLQLQGLSEGEKESISDHVVHGWTLMRRLADLIMKEKSKRGTRGVLRRDKGHGQKNKSLGKWAQGPAFESLETAISAMEAIRSGKSVDEVLGGNKVNPDTGKDKAASGLRRDESHEVLLTSEGNEDHLTRSEDEHPSKDDPSK